jgi:hypothetical protein
MTTRFSSSLVLLLVAIAIALAAPAARAEPSAADVETARSLYVEGLELRDKNALPQSLARFRAAHALAATPITALELGRAHVLVGELVEARDVFLSVERLPVSPTESPKAARARVDAAALAEQLKTRIPTMRVLFAKTPPAPPRVTIDGDVIPPEAQNAPRRVNPGRHKIVAELDDARATVEVNLAESEARLVTLDLERKPASGPSSAESPGLGAWFYAGLATAGIGTTVGTIAGIVALNKAHDLDGVCVNDHCPRSAESDLSTSRTAGTVSTIAFVVAGVGVVVTVFSLLTRPSAPARAGR